MSDEWVPDEQDSMHIGCVHRAEDLERRAERAEGLLRSVELADIACAIGDLGSDHGVGCGYG